VTVGQQSARADHGSIAEGNVAGGDISTSHTINNGPNITAGRDVAYSERNMTIHRRGD
jgi:hypothetical protein